MHRYIMEMITMVNRFYIVFLIFVYICFVPALCLSDLNVVKEVVITPKGVNAAANIGSVNSSVNVRLDSAIVDIHVGTPGGGSLAPLPLNVKATFTLINESPHELKLTIGFPVSNSQYSSFKLAHFSVVTDGAVREVFRRKSSYPRNLTHEYVSGEKGPRKAAPPIDEASQDAAKLFGRQFIGGETFQNLMVWEEIFSPSQQKKVAVNYEIDIPLQENKTVRQKVEGNYKGAWPQEANNVPVHFLQQLASGQYYFFDYYLTSGGSWAGPIASEDVTLHFDYWWRDLEFHSTIKKGEIGWSNQILYPDLPIVATYQLRNEEPTENIYFAIRPGKKNKSGESMTHPSPLDISGNYVLYREGDLLGKVAGYMRISEQHGNQFLISIAYPTGDPAMDWKGSGVVNGNKGYYDWMFTDGKKGRTTFRIDKSGNLHGMVRGSRINWDYVAQREIKVIQPPNRSEKKGKSL